MLVSSIFSFPHNVLKKHVFQGRENPRIIWEKIKQMNYIYPMQFQSPLYEFQSNLCICNLAVGRQLNFTKQAHFQLFNAQSQVLIILKGKAIENIVAKGENASNHQFTFPTVLQIPLFQFHLSPPNAFKFV